MQKQEISWHAPEYEYYEKHVGWYVFIAIIGLIMLGYAIWHLDYTMFFTLAVVLGVGYWFSHLKPRMLNVTLSGQGVELGEQSFPYRNLKKFWIIYQPSEVKTLNFETTNYVNRDLTIQLADQDPNEVRTFLLQYLPEDLEKEEPYTEQLLRRLRF